MEKTLLITPTKQYGGKIGLMGWDTDKIDNE